MAGEVTLRILRCDGPGKPSRWETFTLPFVKGMNVISALQEIRRNPVTADGARTTPVAWDCSCLEEVCGACTMRINGKVRQSCSALVDQVAEKGKPIVLQPMSKFPVLRDLVVDRSRMFEDLKKVQAWIEVDGTHDLGPGPRQSQEAQQELYPLSRCMACGCCLEACPQYGPQSEFIGAAALNQVRLHNEHPSGALQKSERLDAIMQPGGVADCGKAQNCVEVCPVHIPLVDSIQRVARDTTKRMLFDWLLK